MDRKTRKANLKKLQLPISSTTRQTRSTTTTATTAISKFFTTPTKNAEALEPALHRELSENCISETIQTSHTNSNNSTQPCDELPITAENNTDSVSRMSPIHLSSSPQPHITSPLSEELKKPSKRTKLHSFIYKDKNKILQNTDDFEMIEKKTVKAPNHRSTKPTSVVRTKNSRARSKRQPSIQSAFLRNEQLFSEITAQHCLADNFSPDDMQLALAMSKSVTETNAARDDDEVVVDVEAAADDQESIRNKLRCYGFRTAPKEDYNAITATFRAGGMMVNPRGKPKWANKFTALTLRDDDLQLKKIQRKTEELLGKQFASKSIHDDELHNQPYLIYSSVLRHIKPPKNEEVFRKAELLETDTLENFYVKSLFEISQVKAGHLLKDWNSIQGRDISPTKIGGENAGHNYNEKFQMTYQELELFFNKRTTDEDYTIKKQENIGTSVMECNWTRKENVITSERNNHNINLSSTTQLEKLETENENKNDNKPPDKIEKVVTELIPAVNNNIILQNCIEISSETTEICNLKLSLNDIPAPQTRTIVISNEPKTSAEDLNIKNAISNGCTPLKEPPDKRPKLQTPSSTSCLESLVGKNLSQKTRGTSPDLFADSDTDTEDNKLSTLCQGRKTESYEKPNRSIETFEIYSSDEVKTSSTKTKSDVQSHVNNANGCQIVIDLTQNDEPQQVAEKPTIPSEDFDIFMSSTNATITEQNCEVNTKTDEEQLSDKPNEDRLSDDVEKIVESEKDENSIISLLSSSSAEIDTTEIDSVKEVMDENEILSDIKSTKSTSFLDFLGDKQKSTSFHRKTDVRKIASQSNDSIESNNSLENREIYAFSNISTRKSLSMTNVNVSTSSRKRLSFTQLEQDAYKAIEDDSLPQVKSADRSKNLSYFENNELKSTILHTPTTLRRDSSKFNNFNFKRPNNSFLQALEKKYADFDCDITTCKRKSLSMTQVNVSTVSGNRLSFTQLEQNAYEVGTHSNFNLNSSLHSPSIRRAKSVTISPIKYDENSIDLTQDSDDTENDECIILSDDEINYSIWKADKTINLQVDEEPQIYTQELVQSSDSEEEKATSDIKTRKDSVSSDFESEDIPPDHQARGEIFSLSDNEKLTSGSWQKEDFALNLEKDDLVLEDKELEDIQNIFQNEETSPVFNDENYSFPEFLDAGRNSVQKPKKSTSPVFSLNFDSDQEPVQSDMLYSQSDDIFLYTTPIRLDDLNNEQIDFDTEKTATPLKPPPSKKRNSARRILSEASFLSSPSEKSAPMKRYSSASSTQKFNALLQQAQLEEEKNAEPSCPSADSLTDFDEFDKLVYKTPHFKKVTSLKQPSPAGLQQLLTGEINYHHESNAKKHDAYQTPRNHRNSLLPARNNGNDCKAASKKELHINGRTYEVRVTTTPRPDFRSQTDAELQRQLYNFGMIPMPRLEALKMLEYIYNQTHPILLSKDDDYMGEEAAEDAEFQSAKPPAQLLIPVNKFNLRDCFGDLLLRHQDHLSAELVDEDYIFQTNVTKKISQALLPLHIAWFNLVCSSTALHEAILMYEPIDLQEIFLFLKGLGYRYDPKDLKSFFDRRCIIFRYDLGAPDKSSGSNRHVRKSKKKAAAKKPDKTKGIQHYFTIE